MLILTHAQPYAGPSTRAHPLANPSAVSPSACTPMHLSSQQLPSLAAFPNDDSHPQLQQACSTPMPPASPNDGHPHPMTIAMVAIPVSTLLDGDDPPIPDDDDKGGHTQRSLAQRIVSDGGTITLHFVFLVLNNDFVIFYSRVWRMSNGIVNAVEFCKDCTGRSVEAVDDPCPARITDII